MQATFGVLCERAKDLKRLWPFIPQNGWMAVEGTVDLVSVIVPTYNRSNMLVEAMDSIEAQTYRPIELIVVDDGSTDDTAERVSSWVAEQRDDELQVRYVFQENRGVCAARNRGLLESQGEFIQFLDSDDLLLKNSLADHVRTLRDTDADFAWGLRAFVDEQGRIKWEKNLTNFDPTAGAYVARPLWSTEGPLIRRQVCVEIGPFDELLHGCEEHEYFARLKAAGFRGKFRREVVSHARVHGGPSLTRQKALTFYTYKERASDRILNMLREFNITDPREYQRLTREYLKCAWTFASHGGTADSRRCLHKARKIAPGSLKAVIALLEGSSRVVPLWFVLNVCRYGRRAVLSVCGR